MPELPEVETVRRTLKNLICDKTITDVMFFYDGIVKNPSPKEFKKRIIGQKFHDIRRYGKYLLFDLDDFTMVSHLRMEGKYFIRNSLDELTKHEHVVFALDDSKYLSYHDVRKFGTMELVDLQQENVLVGIQEMGPEIPDSAFNAEYLYSKTRLSNSPIKSLLLDQHVISGLGNIYVDETLYIARVHPLEKSKNVGWYKIEKIVKAAKEVIAKAIDLGGTTIRTYQSSLGVDGRFQNELNVHTLSGNHCPLCDDTIQKIRVGGRGTYYCPTCQKNDDHLIIGLTGGIASGKSMLAKMFENEGVKVLDADKIYKNLLKTNKIMYNEIVKNFGEAVETNGIIDTSALGKIVFSDSKKRELLNSITHPFVLEKMNQKIHKAFESGIKTIVLDIPLLFEVKMDYLTDFVILAYVDETIQLQRLMERGNIDKSSASCRINSQMPLDKKRELADVIIDNSGTISQTKEQFKTLMNKLRSEGHVI